MAAKDRRLAGNSRLGDDGCRYITGNPSRRVRVGPHLSSGTVKMENLGLIVFVVIGAAVQFIVAYPLVLIVALLSFIFVWQRSENYNLLCNINVLNHNQHLIMARLAQLQKAQEAR
jgi:hypothetical protein